MSMDKNLWMGDVKPWMDESFIMQAFNHYNFFPQNIKLIHDKVTKELKNYCFVNFQTIEEANKCLLFLTGKTIPNTQIKFKLNWANYFSAFNKSVYVGNLSPDVDDICLYKLFKEKYPSVHHASVISDKGVSKGFGFIQFKGEEDYEKCLKEMNGTLFHGNIIKVNEQKKSNKNNHYNGNSSYDNSNDYENDNEDYSGSNDNSNMDIIQNYGDNSNKYNIFNNSMDYIFQNNNINDTNHTNNNSIIDFYNLNNGFKNGNNPSPQLNPNLINLNNGNINQQTQNDYISQLHLNNPNIIHNIININNINKIHNINYINDINKIYSNNRILAQNGNPLNNVYINSMENINTNNINNNNNLEIPKKQQIQYSNIKGPNKPMNEINININTNNNIIKNKDINPKNEIIEEVNHINMDKNNNINNINKPLKNDIMTKINSLILNNKTNKKMKKLKYNLEILRNYENKILNKIIANKLDIMYKYYIEKYPYELNRFILSNMFIYYCQNEKQLDYFTNVF